MADPIDRIVALALDEDAGPGDVTTLAVVPAAARGRGRAVAREPLVVAGTEAARRVFLALDPDAEVRVLVADGAEAGAGDAVLEVRGALRAVLTGERTALNFLMRLSGIATETRRWVRALEGTKAALLDTRKTTPGLRALEKAAVRAGGARNHRAGLYDGVLVKDNHVAAAGSVGEAVRRARAGAHGLLRVEVEVHSAAQAEEALAAGADALLADNLEPGEVARVIAAARGKASVEASGGVSSPERARAFGQAGVDFVSAGAITHSARWVDYSLVVDAG
jgi:nicotinate-nucleotide pyrophosphorylase (carboxylating)